MIDKMTEQAKQKIRITLSESKRRFGFKEFKKFGKLYIIIVILIAGLEAILDLTGIMIFSFTEGMVDFFALTISFVVGIFTLPIMRTKLYRQRYTSMLEIAGLFVSIQIAGLLTFYFLFPSLSSTTDFVVFISSEIVYQIAFNLVVRSYKFNRRFFSVQTHNGIKIHQNADGSVQTIDRSDFLTGDMKKIIEDKIRGTIGEEEFLEAISTLDSTQKEFVISLTSGIESRLKNKYRL